MPKLSDIIKVHRRYYRSVNLERDMTTADSVLGYVPTNKSLETLQRILDAYMSPRATRSWTITGTYGTGKSSFAHLLSSLSAPSSEKIKKNSINVIKESGKEGVGLANTINKFIPKKGLVRAIVTAQAEPIKHTILRGLERGALEYWSNSKGAKPKFFKDLNKLTKQINSGHAIDNQEILKIAQNIAYTSGTGLLIIVDELGKSLEFASQNQSTDDLYILQQLAELPNSEKDPKILFLGLLHQSFSDYSNNLTTNQRSEWAKIQGRFEDIPFSETTEQTIKLIASSIDTTNINSKFKKNITQQSNAWKSSINKLDALHSLSTAKIADTYPLHPISTIILPILCSRYAQNDRTLFTFLTSNEPNSFQSFLKITELTKTDCQLLKINNIYDYFIESAGLSTSSRPQSQRWIEIHNKIHDARNLEIDEQIALKCIGIFNLIATSGPLKASRELVTLSLCDLPTNKKNFKYWDNIISTLIKKNYITWRKQIDELRIWEGTDFDIEQEIEAYTSILKNDFLTNVNEFFQLKPLIAPKHSYNTGTLRFFERIFTTKNKLENLEKNYTTEADGLICYLWNITSNIKSLPQKTADGKPIIILTTKNIRPLELAYKELLALESISKNSNQLRTDGVARKEVNERITQARGVITNCFETTFSLNSKDVNCIHMGKKISLKRNKGFKSFLSEVCDNSYPKGLTLWNELINKNQITAQGAKARRLLIENMIENNGLEKLNLTGNGPEVSILNSLLIDTGIYKHVDGQWTFTTPTKKSGAYNIWKEIESFCKKAKKSPQPIITLYNTLTLPPFGVRKEVIPVLLLSVLQTYSDDLSLYMDGTFVPLIRPEHFELLVKNHSRFSIKYFEIAGVRSKIFAELENIFQKQSNTKPSATRNKSLLAIVHPLVKFSSKLPNFTKNTRSLSKTAINVRTVLSNAKEPDELLFNDLPKALGIESFKNKKNITSTEAKEFRKLLSKALQELQEAYQHTLLHCKDLIYNAFKIRSDKDKLREDLSVRSTYLLGHCIEPVLKSFLMSATNDIEGETNWLEPILTVVTDKPPENWKDEDLLIFESNLNNISRKFINLEALQKDMVKFDSSGFTTRRITITKPDGTEINRLLWLDNDVKNNMNTLVKNILNKEGFANNKELQMSLVATLIEQISQQSGEARPPKLKVLKERKVGKKRN